MVRPQVPASLPPAPEELDTELVVVAPPAPAEPDVGVAPPAPAELGAELVVVAPPVSEGDTALAPHATSDRPIPVAITPATAATVCVPRITLLQKGHATSRHLT
jgi:hypothetical protein